MSFNSDWPGGLIGLLLTALFGAFGLVFIGYVGKLALEIAANALGRPLTRRDRLVMAAFIPLVLLLAWRLSFQQFTYGTVAVFLLAGGLLWLWSLLHGDTWVSPQEKRFNTEYIGPVTLLLISGLMFWNAISPFI